MLELYVVPPTFGVRNISPFCFRTEMLLKSLGLDFKLVEEPDPRKAPKGKLPYLRDDTLTVADSELIFEHLNEKTQGAVYAGLSDRQIAEGRAISRLIDDHLYWMLVASRWLDDGWWPNVVEGFFHIVPGIARGFVSSLARREVKQTYHLQGLGRHSQEEQMGFARRDFAALAAFVPEEGFLGGETPRVFDFTLAGFLDGVYAQQPRTWLNDIADEFPVLATYTLRVKEAVGVT